MYTLGEKYGWFKHLQGQHDQQSHGGESGGSTNNKATHNSMRQSVFEFVKNSIDKSEIMSIVVNGEAIHLMGPKGLAQVEVPDKFFSEIEYSVHNHPGSASFSGQDISLFLECEKMKQMDVVGKDGTLYSVKKDQPEKSHMAALRKWKEIEEQKRSPFQERYNKGEAMEPLWKEETHEVMVSLSKEMGFSYSRTLNVYKSLVQEIKFTEINPGEKVFVLDDTDINNPPYVKEDSQKDLSDLFLKGGPGSGSWEGPGDPRFAHEDVFHGTTIEMAEKIIQDGLTSREHREVFATTDFEMAAYFASKSYKIKAKEVAIIIVSKDAIEIDRSYLGDKILTSKDNIPAEKIKRAEIYQVAQLKKYAKEIGGLTFAEQAKYPHPIPIRIIEGKWKEKSLGISDEDIYFVVVMNDQQKTNTSTITKAKPKITRKPLSKEQQEFVFRETTSKFEKKFQKTMIEYFKDQEKAALLVLKKGFDEIETKGNANSGNHGHEGRPGEVGGSGSGGGVGSLLVYSKEGKQAIQQALLKTRETGKEVSILFGAKGELLGSTEDDKSEGAVDLPFHKDLNTAGANLQSIHTHPNEEPLSYKDIETLANYDGLRIQAAITPAGNIHVAEKTSSRKELYTRTNELYLKLKTDAIDEGIAGRITSKEQADSFMIAGTKKILQTLDKEGLIKYNVQKLEFTKSYFPLDSIEEQVLSPSLGLTRIFPRRKKVVQKGGPGSGSWNGPDDPRFAHEGRRYSEDEIKRAIETVSRLTLSGGTTKKRLLEAEESFLKQTVQEDDYTVYRGLALMKFRLTADQYEAVKSLKAGDEAPAFLSMRPIKRMSQDDPVGLREGVYSSSSKKEGVANRYAKEANISIVLSAKVMKNKILADGEHLEKLLGKHDAKTLMSSEDYAYYKKEKEVFLIEPVKYIVHSIKINKSFDGLITKASPNALPDRFDFSGWAYKDSEWNRRLQAEGGLFIKEVYEAEGKRVWEQLALQLQDGLEGAFDIDNPLVQEFIQNYGYKFTQGINETTVGMLQGAMTAGMDEGLGMDGIAKLIRGVFDNCTKYRSMLIARTETIRASNGAAKMAYEQSEVVEGMEWLTTRDDRRCKFCLAMDGKVVGLDENYFELGDSLTIGSGTEKATMKFDYEAVGYPPLHPACRCAVVPKVYDEYLIPKSISTLHQEGLDSTQNLVLTRFSSPLKGLSGVFGLGLVFKGGPGSGNYNGPGDPRFAHGGTGSTVDVNVVGQKTDAALKELKISDLDIEKAVTVEGWSGKCKVDTERDTIVVSNTWYGEGKEKEGSIIFTLPIPSKNKKEAGKAFLDYLMIVKDDQGKAVGSEVIKKMEDLFHKAGMTEVTLLADVSIGTYSWAKAGYDYDSKDMLTSAKSLLKNYVAESSKAFEVKFSKERKVEILLQIQSCKSARDIATFSIPELKQKISYYKKLGTFENEDVPGKLVVDVGKAFMLDEGAHGQWTGSKKL